MTDRLPLFVLYPFCAYLVHDVQQQYSPEISGILAEVAKRRWKMCDPGSWKGLKRLKEAVRHQTAFVRMLDSGSAARKSEHHVHVYMICVSFSI